jgi:hypothetical protein
VARHSPPRQVSSSWCCAALGPAGGSGLLAGAAVWFLLGAKASQRKAQRGGQTSEPLRSVGVRAAEQVKTRMEQTGAVDVEWGRDREPLRPVR